MALTQRQIWVGQGNRMMSLLPDVLLFGPDVTGIPSSWNYISLWLLYLALRLTMMAMEAQPQMLWFGTSLISQGYCGSRFPSWTPGFLGSSWCSLAPSPVTLDDVAVWPYSVNILLEFSFFLTTLWPQDVADLGKCGVSYFELLGMFETREGHRLIGEKAFP